MLETLLDWYLNTMTYLPSVGTSKRPQVKTTPNLNVPELDKTFQLKHLRLITGNIGRNLASRF